MTVTVQPVTPDRWDDLVAFFGPNGAYSNCWCAWFRVRAKDYDGPANRRLLQRLTREGAVPGLQPANRRLLQRLTREGAVPGLLGYDGGGPVGWVSVAPREQFERILRSRAIGPAQPDELGVWSLVCFWIPARHRRKGVGTALLDGAVAYARSQHAALVEAYPVDTAGEKRPGAELFTGTVAMFQRAGFTITQHPGSGRPIARLTV